MRTVPEYPMLKPNGESQKSRFAKAWMRKSTRHRRSAGELRSGNRCLWAVCFLAVIAYASDGPMGVERVARLVPTGYRSTAESDTQVRWVQVDLGESHKIDKVKLFPVANYAPRSQGFPACFKIEASDEPDLKPPGLIADQTGSEFPNPADEVAVFVVVGEVSGRYVRVTATHLRDRELRFSKLEVWSGGKDVAEGCPASDSVAGSLGKIGLTRTPRPQGEEVVTDYPGNVIPASQWKPVAYSAQAPLTGVRLDDGVFKTAMQNNVAYLLSSFTVDELLRPFRQRAGKPNPPGMRDPDGFWDNDLAGSNAGRFLMGAGNTIRWLDDPELHRRLNQVVDGIEECRQTNGYIMAYPEDTLFYSERAAYTRSWLTQGLIEAGFGGNAKAFELLRGYYDWFDRCPYLPELLRRGGQGVQGMIANTRMYFTPVGKPEDLQVIQRYFQENYWLDELAHREERAIWQYPYDHPHSYLITSIEPYLDLYRATGAKRYLEAALGGWDLYHDNWEHIGGSIAICEGDLSVDHSALFPPRSYVLHQNTGELCGNVFWIRLNQRFALLHPDREQYVNEIEKSLYNVGLPNQGGTEGICYTAKLLGHKDAITHKNTCCEGQGTRLYGSLPEYIYSIAKDGIYVNLFAASTIQWPQQKHSLKAHLITEFPFQPEVQLRISVAEPTHSKIHVRVPAWASREMPICVNGKTFTIGRPGTFALVNRKWEDGDTLSFVLPMGFKLTRYEGTERVEGRERYALEYGPILMAAVGTKDEESELSLNPADLIKRLMPKADEPLHFSIEGDAQHEYLPYWQVQQQVFTCLPVIRDPAGTRISTSTGSP